MFLKKGVKEFPASSLVWKRYAPINNTLMFSLEGINVEYIEESTFEFDIKLKSEEPILRTVKIIHVRPYEQMKFIRDYVKNQKPFFEIEIDDLFFRDLRENFQINVYWWVLQKK
jgi:hypothetical protein